MQRLKTFRVIMLAVALAIMPSVGHAWNYTGHRIIGSIAYRQLDDATRKRVADVLKKHPAYNDLWLNRRTNGPNEIENLFWNASVFPDDARSDPWRKYGRSAAHYVNYRILNQDGTMVEPPLRGENVINSYVAHLGKIVDEKTPDDEKALHLRWLFHQAGDIHQPLHAVARFSKALPQGDRGGNGVTVPNPRSAGDRGNNFHAYWDDLLGRDDSPAAIGHRRPKVPPLSVLYPIKMERLRDGRPPDNSVLSSVLILHRTALAGVEATGKGSRNS
jgi:hypothetical protein